MKDKTSRRYLRAKLAVVISVLAGAVSILRAAEIPPPPLYPGITPVCSCESLTNISLPNTTIDSATLDPSSGSCRVTATVTHPPAGDRVRIWIALPVTNWNGRFRGNGGGGFSGGSAGSLRGPAAQGYAAAATDTGHEGGSGSFALDPSGRLNWQAIQDNAYLGIHDMTVVGKALTRAFYGKAPGYSYFVGGSTGGRQGLMEAQRYPDDYDGILSACPAINWHRFLPADIWPQVVMVAASHFVPKAKLAAATAAAVAACDSLDGVTDGVLDDPARCAYDPKALVGTKVGAGTFTEKDAEVIRKIWEGPRGQDGAFLWHGLARGTDLSALAGTTGSPLTGRPFSIPLEWFQYFLLQNPKWDWTTLTPAGFELLWRQSVEEYGAVIGTDDPDLSRFRDRGGKIIILHGLADQLIPAAGTIDYYRRVQQRLGGPEQAARFARLFLAPGVDHGFRGAGPTPTGQMDALVRWVEQDQAPDKLLAERRDSSGKILRTRPLFPYPLVARYNGTGDTDDAASFSSRMPEPEARSSEVEHPASGVEAGRAVPLGAQEFPLSAVKLLDGPFRRAMETDKAYLLRLDPDRLLAGFRRESGLPRKADPYGGWETIPEKGRYSLAGQALGHYLSALSLMAAATGDPACRRRVEDIVTELSACQKAAGTGILCAFPESKQIFAEIAAGQIKSDHLFGLNGGYVPLYVTHKVMAGLRDAWVLLGNPEARDVLVRMADWLGTVVKDLTEAQIREMLETEHGGIMEVVADVYAITGDARYLALAKRLNHQSLFEPLSRGEDVLTGLHANAQIPKVIGMERIHQLTGDSAFGKAARYFWDDVVHNRSFVIGGHGAHEFFFAPDAFATRGVTSTTGPETCNTYNMIKLSRRLWLMKPSEPVADFIERALYNHILPSQEPDRGGFVYFTSMRPGHYRTYSSDTEDFWCCTDTGMESQAKYGEFIYAHAGDRLWVDLLIPSELDWAERGVRLRLDTRFPEDGKATLSFETEKPQKLEIAVRYPSWLKPGDMKLAVNGSPEPVAARPGSSAVIERSWKTGDRLEVEWPLRLRTEMLPGSQEWITVLLGPVVLAGELGTAGLEGLDFSGTHNYVATEKVPVESVPVFIGNALDVIARLKPVPGRPLTFRTTGLARPTDVSLAPFYCVHRQRYAVYWRLMDQATYDAERRKAE